MCAIINHTDMPEILKQTFIELGLPVKQYFLNIGCTACHYKFDPGRENKSYIVSCRLKELNDMSRYHHRNMLLHTYTLYVYNGASG